MGTPLLLNAQLLVLALNLLASSSFSTVKHFRQLEKSGVPEAFLEHLCSGIKEDAEKSDCIQDFKKDGSVWAGDVNDDGVDEYIVDPGGMPGSLGPPRGLVQRRGQDWADLLCLGGEECFSSWNTLHARFDILPTVRKSYHDLRIEVDHCVKWDGQHYIDYDDADYSRLRPEWFDASDSHEAEIFWTIQYRKSRTIRFEPRWFPISAEEFNRPVRTYIGLPARIVELPKLPYASQQDSEPGLRWLSFFKGGVWGVNENRAFLLVPQPSYLGAQRLELHGDWLFIYTEVDEVNNRPPDIRYNRRTHELIFPP
jgi:hypothetical protein